MGRAQRGRDSWERPVRRGGQRKRQVFVFTEGKVTEPSYLDIELPAGATFKQALPAGHNAFVYVYRGGVKIAGTDVPVQRMAILDNNGGDGVTLTAPAASRVLLIAGKPLNEPIAQYGPFVMNSNEEIFQAVQDFQNGRF